MRFVESRQFLETGAFESIKLANRRNQLFRVQLEGLPRPLMMKINWLNEKYSNHWQRMLEFWHLRHIGDEKKDWERRTDLAQSHP